MFQNSKMLINTWRRMLKFDVVIFCSLVRIPKVSTRLFRTIIPPQPVWTLAEASPLVDLWEMIENFWSKKKKSSWLFLWCVLGRDPDIPPHVPTLSLFVYRTFFNSVEFWFQIPENPRYIRGYEWSGLKSGRIYRFHFYRIKITLDLILCETNILLCSGLIWALTPCWCFIVITRKLWCILAPCWRKICCYVQNAWEIRGSSESYRFFHFLCTWTEMSFSFINKQ